MCFLQLNETSKRISSLRSIKKNWSYRAIFLRALEASKGIQTSEFEQTGKAFHTKPNASDALSEE